MIQTCSPVISKRTVGNRTPGPPVVVLRIHAPGIAPVARPGQFVNIGVGEWGAPLLRRPFSIYRTHGDALEIIFNVVGPGTTFLARRRKGDLLNLLGPLGNSFSLDGEYETAVLAAGGLGVAPLPMLTAALRKERRAIATFLGARTASQLIGQHLVHLFPATDDGSAGYHGTVVDAVRERLRSGALPKPKLFACGPNAMLRELARLAEESAVPCEVSLESPMACGIGICQGCPVETVGRPRAYALVCTEGTVFDTRTIRIP